MHQFHCNQFACFWVWRDNEPVYFDLSLASHSISVEFLYIQLYNQHYLKHALSWRMLHLQWKHDMVSKIKLNSLVCFHFGASCYTPASFLYPSENSVTKFKPNILVSISSIPQTKSNYFKLFTHYKLHILGVYQR